MSWPAPGQITDSGPQARLGVRLPSLPALEFGLKPICAATIRSGVGYMEVPFFATHEGRRYLPPGPLGNAGLRKPSFGGSVLFWRGFTSSVNCGKLSVESARGSTGLWTCMPLQEGSRGLCLA